MCTKWQKIGRRSAPLNLFDDLADLVVHLLLQKSSMTWANRYISFYKRSQCSNSSRFGRVREPIQIEIALFTLKII